MLAVRDLLRDLDVRLVGGEAGVDNAVRWVHISEIVDPTPWLSGGELLLTTGLQLEHPDTQREYVARLAGHGLSGLGLGTGFAHAGVPEAMIEAAEEHSFPLFEVPYEVPFIAVTEKAFTHLVNEHYAVLQRALSAHERLERIVLSERGLDGVAGALASLIGGPAIIFDARGEVLARRAARQPLQESAVSALADELRERARAGGRRGYAPGGELSGRALALPVPRTPQANGPAGDGPAPQAWLVAAKDGGPLTEFDRLTLHQAVTVVALELLRRRVADDTERRLAGDVLSAMVSGELDGAELARRLQPFGLRDRAAVVVLTPPRPLKAATEDALARALREEAPAGLAAGTGNFSCVLLAPPRGGDDEELFALAERLRVRVSGEVGTDLSAGAGRIVPAGELRRAFHEARCALEARGLADSNGSSPGLATYRDLGSFQLLLSLQDDEALRLFCDSILAPIEEGEGAYGGELMRSLEAFIECNGQWERAARQLYCHRHTLRYRIRRVEELTGRSLDSARDRIDFWLALRGRELTKGTA
ncbi:MAG TPA: PucR family transcriptional regulator ligand-binding domain-containing protein [Solirubrobacteraceae bacterium]|nr:PucR family transcriptional regulator ligand-binding domain-containing protein [Solirubrobacteraceae bacterium]